MRAATEEQVGFTCVWCGKPVSLLVTGHGDEIPDAHAFLVQHAACLHRGDPPPQTDATTIVLP